MADEKITVGKALDYLVDGDKLFTKNGYVSNTGYEVLYALKGEALVDPNRIRDDVSELYKNPDITEAEENLLDAVIAIIDKYIDEYNEPLDD